ncbi:TIGR03564 family F420-dependent LLM class oxidoreductase [Myxococcota bacterium]|nr:TIGR03564 family F420-dependent LLM class oxidoreductase [Myxococcota bacterium]
MRVGVMVGEGTGAAPSIPGILERTQRAEELGIDSAWIAQIAVDAMTAAAAAGARTSRIELGTAVVPTFTRHPFTMAQAAASAQDASGGRFTLGIGLSHQMVIEGMFGLSYEKPAAHMREYLEVLAPLARGEELVHQGDRYTARIQGIFRTGVSFPVLIAALGPVMLRLAGSLAGGTITWAAGLRTLGDFVVPTLRQAATEAGRPEPRVVAGLPVVVTGDLAHARERAVEVFGHYKAVPSYRAMLDREGVEGVEEIAVLGDEGKVRAELGRLADAGVTDLCVFPFDAEPGSGDRTLELLGSLGQTT